MQAQMIDVGQVRLHVVTAGEGTPVVLLHGFPSFWQSWRHQIGYLAAAGFRVIAPDLRGYNLSEKPHGIDAYTLDRVAGDIVGLVHALGYESAPVVGHDWGAAVGWQLAMTYPSAVERLVVMNVSHPSITRRKLLTPQRMLKWWYMFFFQLPWLPELCVRNAMVMKHMLTSISAHPDAFSEDDLKAHLEAIRRPGAATAALNYYRAGLRARSGGRRSHVSAPTLVLWSENDPLLGDDLLEGLESYGPDIRIQRVPRAGHWLQMEAADDVNHRLLAFLNESRTQSVH